MAFPWICFKCGFNAYDKADLVDHIVRNEHQLSEGEKDMLLQATKEVIVALQVRTILARTEELHACFGPVLQTHKQWKEHPETFVPDTDMDEYVRGMRAYYKVTPKEWAEITEWFTA